MLREEERYRRGLGAVPIPHTVGGMTQVRGPKADFQVRRGCAVTNAPGSASQVEAAAGTHLWGNAGLESPRISPPSLVYLLSRRYLDSRCYVRNSCFEEVELLFRVSKYVSITLAVYSTLFSVMLFQMCVHCSRHEGGPQCTVYFACELQPWFVC